MADALEAVVVSCMRLGAPTFWTAVACIVAFAPAAVNAEEGFDTEHIFGFMIGSDVGNQGVVVAHLGEDRARGSHDVENAPFRRQPAHATKRSGLRHGILPRLLLCLLCFDFHRSSILVVA